MPTEDLLEFGEKLFESERLAFRNSTQEDFELLSTWSLDPLTMVLQSPHAVLLKNGESIAALFRDLSQVRDSGFGYSIDSVQLVQP